jgi:hypothetical protein
MIPLNLVDLQILIAALVLVLGFFCILFGMIVLITRGYTREVRALAAQTAKLGQKGVAQEVTGLVSSASELVTAINQLVRTATGIGIFLIFLGIAMLSAGYWIIVHINWAAV